LSKGTGFLVSEAKPFINMFRTAVRRISLVGEQVYQQAQRNIGVTAAVANKANLDPIQQLFVDKIREYASKSVGGKLVDASPETEATLKGLLDNLEKGYGAKGVNMTQFPAMQFSEPTLEYPGLSGDQKAKLEAAATAAEEAKAEEEAEMGLYDDWQGGMTDAERADWATWGWQKHEVP